MDSAHRSTPASPERANAIEDEVAWGEGWELVILRRWLACSRYAEGAARWVGSDGFDDYDFLVLDARGVVLCYAEVKRRRTALAKYGDALFPIRKHEFALLVAEQNVPFVGVTEYGCGALTEVNLTEPPAKRKDIARRDRPGMTPVPHGLYSKAQLVVLDG